MTWDWQELVAVLLSAAVGWLMRHLGVWLPPAPPKE